MVPQNRAVRKNLNDIHFSTRCFVRGKGSLRAGKEKRSNEHTEENSKRSSHGSSFELQRVTDASHTHEIELTAAEKRNKQNRAFSRNLLLD